MPDTAEPTLVWVIVDGTPRHVSDFAALPPRRRPAALCPHCGRRLTLKLGDVLRHHAAHAAGHVCAATQPETALHLNCKLALAAALRTAAGPDARLRIVRTCAGISIASLNDSCEQTLTTEWASAWTGVAVELGLADAHRPDIVLLAGDRVGDTPVPTHAIEIVVTHEVSPEKARALAELGVPWIEVAADERLTHADAWRLGAPLAVLRASDVPEWRCPPHAATHAAAVAANRAQRLAERQAQRHTSVLRAARVVDLYHAGGVRERFIYRIVERRFDGHPRSLVLSRGNLHVATVDAVDHDSAAPLRLAFRADVEQLRRDEHSFIDSPMRWATGDAAENIVEEALIDRTPADPTPLATTFPRRWFYANARGEWFLPREMRDVRWDREPLDVFAAHPAWHRARAAVRERPAPEGSWQTPIFAARPIGAMFGTVNALRTAAPGVSVVAVDSTEAVSGDHRRRAIIVLERAVDEETIASLARELSEAAVDVVWLSHPRDWTPALAPLVWAAAGRDQRGFGAVLVDGLGVFRADRFLKALAKADRRLTASAIRRAMAERVGRLAAAR